MLANKNKSGKTQGVIQFGDEIIGRRAFRSISGFVDQEDKHLATMTVRETIQFSATLRLPESMSKADKSKESLSPSLFGEIPF